jgi:hypothetical protein
VSNKTGVCGSNRRASAASASNSSNMELKHPTAPVED